MKIVVTGGAGMIGSNLVRRLCKEGHEVKVIDSLWRGKLDNLAGIPGFSTDRDFTLADLSQLGDWTTAFRDVDVVYHLADIVAGIGFVFSHEGYLFRQNILINTNVFFAVRQFSVGRLIYVGTACSFPLELQRSVDGKPMEESQQYPANPESAYGWSKLMGEYEAGLIQKETDTKVVILAFHNVYGFPTDYNTPRSQVIPSLINRLLFGEGDMVVWGSGAQGRAFIFIDDVIEALHAGLTKGENQGVIQIGPSECTTIRTIAESLIRLEASSKKIVYDKTKPEGDIGRSANYSKAKRLLGWEPRTKLDEGLRKTIQWIKETAKTQ